MEHPSGGLQIPYHLPDGTLAPRYRVRTALVAKEGSRWSKGEGTIVPYGLGRLEEARKAGYLVLVEGESDCWTLWYHGFPALGLPGAEMARTLEESMLTGIDRLYLMQEPDAGGTAFVNQLTRKLEGWQWPGKAFVLRLEGAKDPNELHQHDRQGFRTAFQHALDLAEPLSSRSSQPASSPSQQGQPAIFSLPDLLSWELPPVRWTIPEILPEGLTLLAGKPKLGKSWLALSVALSIAAGGVALGAQPVAKGDVLYLALEDNARRLQSRARRLLASMTETPSNLEFALDWPRLGEGGLAYLEEYLKTHPDLRLVVIDTWARVAPPSGERRCSQYEGDYESLTPLKRLADTYHVSILAVHHLRKTGSSDVLDEIIGSTGVTGAVDGTMILKRDRGQTDATLFVTGRDVEREQQLALSFDATTALWTLVGNAEELCCTRARQEILDLLREQGPDGMSAREIAATLPKNYHTTRSLLRKMEDAGEVRHADGHYLAVSADSRHTVNGRHCMETTTKNSRNNSNQPIVLQVMTVITMMTVITVMTLMTRPMILAQRDALALKEQVCITYRSRSVHVKTWQKGNRSMTKESLLTFCVINVIMSSRNHCHHRHHMYEPISAENVQGASTDGTDNTAREEQTEAFLRRNRCPHHPHAQLVRFDPAGQAWCDKLDCWDSYRLMKIGEALEYRCLTDLCGKVVIEQGMAAWSDYVLTQRAFLVVVATEQAIVLCKAMGIEVPDVSGEVKRLVEVRPAPS